MFYLILCLIFILLLLFGCNRPRKTDRRRFDAGDYVSSEGFGSYRIEGGCWHTRGPSAVSPNGEYEAWIYCQYNIDVPGARYHLYICTYDDDWADLPADERWRKGDVIAHFFNLDIGDSDAKSIEEFVPEFKVKWLSDVLIQTTDSQGNIRKFRLGQSEELIEIHQNRFARGYVAIAK